MKDEVKQAAKKVTDSDTYLGSDDERENREWSGQKGSNESRGHSKTWTDCGQER